MSQKPAPNDPANEAAKKEGRQHARRRTSDYLLVTDLESGQTVGRVLNLSPTGLMVMTVQELKVGQCFNLKLALPTPIVGKQHLEIIAECRWSTYRKAADWWENGLEIDEMSEEDHDVLQQLIVELMQHNGEIGTTAGNNFGSVTDKVEYVRLRRYRRDKNSS